MAIINVSHPTGSYPIYLESGALANTGQHLAQLGYRGRCAIVTNQTVGPLHAEPLLASLREAGFEPIRLDLLDGEQFKTLETVAGLYPRLVAAKLDRRSPVIALGGGVVGDMAGFVAASYLRGVPFVQIPTTLLAMVDASVGGKTGVDLPQGKNLVGAFKQPEMVVMDPDVLGTLPEVEFRAGLAEVVKHGIIDAPALFAALEQGDYDLTWLLDEAVRVKVRVVQADPFEQGRRAVLNLGHTFGHAFEQLSRFELRHGEGVAIGLACAARLATRLGHCSGATTERIISLLDQLQLPFTPPAYPFADMWAAMFSDKKRQGNTVRFILPRAIGDVDIFNEVTEADVRAILDKK
ncbi:MAG: 3-dehydroquinate synthase [Anaerolineae bacterium]|nr:3-dehydroquinate synthase [Anaerolineae bacterium]